MKSFLLNTPWLHFLLIGLALHIALPLFEPAPEPETIELPPARVEQLREQWTTLRKNPPSEAQWRNVLEQEVEQEILFREALARNVHRYDSAVAQRLIRDLRFLDSDNDIDSEAKPQQLVEKAIELQLHENDPVVRRLLISRMKMQAFLQHPAREPEDAILLERFEARGEEFVHAAQISFSHVYLGEDAADDQQRATSLLGTLNANGAPGAQSQSHSKLFLPGLDFNGLTQQRVTAVMGRQFAEQLFAHSEQQQQWLGPLDSSFGEHLVWIESYTPPRPMTFDNVRKRLRSEWIREQEELAVDQLLATLSGKYEVNAWPEY